MTFGSLLRPLLLGLFFGVSPCGCGGAAAASGPFGAPPALVDYGRVFEGSILAHVWEVDVRAPLTLAAAKPDCGCTLAQVERAVPGGREPYVFGTPLATDDRLFVRATYDTRGRRGPAQRMVALTTTSGEIQPLTLAADIVPWLVIEPPEIAYVRLHEHEPAERDLRVRSALGERFLLRATGRGIPPAVAIELTPEDADAAGRATTWKAKVRLGPDVPVGGHSYPIELESDVPIPGEPASGAARTFTIAPPWNLQVVGPVGFSTPDLLEFGLVDPAETVARSVRVESFDPAFVLAEPEAHLEPLKPGDPLPLASTAQVHVRAVSAGKAYDIELVLAGLAPAATGTCLGRVVIATGHPDPRFAHLTALVRATRLPGTDAPGKAPPSPR